MATIYRAEVIGSMLRPGWLKQARIDFAADRISSDQFKRLEDRAVDAAIALQQRAGVDIVSDGEMRRSGFVAPLTDYVEGLEAVPFDTRRWQGGGSGEPGETDLAVPLTVTGKLRRRRSLAAEEFIYARARAKLPLKATLPSPLMLAMRWSPEHSAAAYPEPFTLFADALEILRAEVAELVSLGCEYIQIDAPELATLVDPATRERVFEAHGISPARMLGEGVEMLNSLAEGSGVTFGLHLCRGNNAGHWLSTGGYETISKEVFARATRYDLFLLEYDSPRAGSFEPLADVARDKRVVLGLVSTKSDTLETPAALIARIEEAAHHFPREQMALSTQCGFASVLAGNPIAEATQEKKLRLVAEVAHQVWN